MSDTESTATSARSGRITEQESFLDLIDQLAYGDLPTWQRLYRTAMADPRMRDTIVRAAQLVDPDFVAAGQVWQTLVTRMPAVAATPAWAAHAAMATSDAGAASVRAVPRLVPPTTSPPASAR